MGTAFRFDNNRGTKQGIMSPTNLARLAEFQAIGEDPEKFEAFVNAVAV